MQSNETTYAAYKDNSWDPMKAYDKVCEEIEHWPAYKKRAYNEMFAVSAHAEKLKL